jgi:hypothetical protein
VHFGRVVEDGLPSPAPQDVASLVHDPLLQSLVRAKLPLFSTPFLLYSAPAAPPAPSLSVEAQQAADQGHVDDASFDRREDQHPQHRVWDESGDLFSVGEGELDNNTLDLDELVADMLRSPPDSGSGGGQLFSSLADDIGFA